MSEWISVKDRLPDEGERILVCGGGSIMLAYSCRDSISRGRKSKVLTWYEYDPYDNGGRINNVTHWMPLPEPPA